MGKFTNIAGKKFGKLTAVRIAGKSKNRKMVWECGCDCGGIINVRVDSLQSGNTSSCDGYYGSPTHRSWTSMKNRCTNSNYHEFHYYGGRGIKVCDRWLESFENFLEDMGERPEGRTLDRINGDLGYCKENCRWATLQEQSQNRRSRK